MDITNNAYNLNLFVERTEIDDVLSYRVFAGKHTVGQGLIDYRNLSGGGVSVSFGKAAAFQQWDAHGLEIIR